MASSVSTCCCSGNSWPKLVDLNSTLTVQSSSRRSPYPEQLEELRPPYKYAVLVPDLELKAVARDVAGSFDESGLGASSIVPEVLFSPIHENLRRQIRRYPLAGCCRFNNPGHDRCVGCCTPAGNL